MNVLLTGATGYIGRRLKRELLSSYEDINLRLFVTDKRQVEEETASKVEIVEGNTFNTEALQQALHGIDTAYYLIHSMRTEKRNIADLDRISAANFIEECVRAGVKRIIYLGGLGENYSESWYLSSRHETGEILSSYPDKVETIWFRAATIIGAGGASYIIIKNLIEKLPLMPAPAWVRTFTQPIAVDDVMSYLVHALKTRFRGNTVVDIGGEKLTFLDMLKQTSAFYSLKRVIIPLPFFSLRLSYYGLSLLTPIPFRLASAIVSGFRSDSIITNNNAAELFPDIRPLSFIEALKRAASEETAEIVSHWSDGSSAWYNSLIKAQQSEMATHISSYKKNISGLDRTRLWKSIISIGGERGWLSMNILWDLRGFIDKFSGGPGINRGRRFIGDVRIGDSIDFWTVVDLVKGKRLLLAAQMKIPGKAWLEFILNDTHLIITAHFIPRGIYGRFYWYLFLPFHALIFKGMLRRLTKECITGKF